MGFFYDDEDEEFDYPDGFDVCNESDWYKLVEDEIKQRELIEPDPADDAEYKDIPGHPFYKASLSGKIRSEVDVVPRILKPCLTNHGHEYVTVIDKDGRARKQLVHRLVAQTFLPNPEGYPLVRHLNDNPTDNRVENLAWGTQKDNIADMVRNGHASTKAVYCYEDDRVYDSCREAALANGVTRSAITYACKSKGTIAGGKHFCLESQKEDRLRDAGEWLKETDSRKPLIAINPKTGEKLYFSSRKEAAKELGIPGCGISSVISGRINTTHGWSFEDVEESDG